MFRFPTSKLMKIFMPIALLFLSISIVLVGCQKTWPEPPDLSAIDTVCLNIEMSRSETELHWIYYDEEIERLLRRMDIIFVPEGEACDATLTLSGTGIPYGDEYSQENSTYTTYCYTGGKVNGKLTFDVPGQDPLIFPFKASRPKQETISGCSKSAPFYEIIYKPMLQAFIHLFGPEFAIRNLVDEKSYITDFLELELENMGADAIPAWIDCLSFDKDGLAGICARSLGELGAVPGVIPGLIKSLESDDLLTRAMAVYALQNIGPEAKDAVPALILVLDDDRISGYDHVINEDAALALYLITGEKLGLDKEAWQDWLRMQGD